MGSIKGFINSKGYNFEVLESDLDGKFHEFNNSGQKGWFVGSRESDSVTFTFGDWRDPDEQHTYIASSNSNTGLKPQAVEKLTKKAEEKKDKQNQLTKTFVEKIFKKLENKTSEPANDYFIRKKLIPTDVFFKAGDGGTQSIAMIPMRDLKGEIWNVQYIGSDGTKNFQPGGRIKGLFHKCGVQHVDDPVYVGEGFATCKSFELATGKAVQACFSASNMKHVIEDMLEAGFDKEKIIVVADWDGGSAPHVGNTGMIEAQKIWEKWKIKCVVPGCEIKESKDFSDLWAQGRTQDIIEASNSLFGAFSGGWDFVAEKKLAVAERKKQTAHQDRMFAGANGAASEQPTEEPLKFETSDEDFSKIKRTTLQDNFVPHLIATTTTGFHFKIPKAKPPGTFDLIPDFEGLVSELNNLYRYRVLEGTDMCFAWNGKIYKQIIKSRIKEFAHQKFYPKPMTAKVTEFVERVMRTKQESVSFFSPMRKINFQNGWLDLDKWEFFNHTDEIGFRNILGYDFMPEADCPNFDLFLNKVTCGDSGLQDLLLQFIGYAVSGDSCWAQKALVLTGSGSNGKSTFLNIMRALLGDENVAPLTLSDMRSEYKLQMLDGKLANMAEETPQRSLMESSLFKNIVGGGTVVLRQIYDAPYQTKLITKLVFACNEMPGSYDTTKAFFRRFIIVPFNAVFEDSQADFDPFIESKLKGELPGIMNKVLKAYLTLKKNKRFVRVEASDETLEEYRTSVDPVRLWVKEEVEIDDACQEAVKASTLYREFKRWCEENGYKAGESCPFFKKFTTVTGKKSETIKFKPKPAKGYKFVRIGTVQNEIAF